MHFKSFSSDSYDFEVEQSLADAIQIVWTIHF